jgi:sortase A
MKNNWFWQIIIDGLIICGFILFSFPFLKENVIGIQLGQSQLVIAEQLPNEFVAEEPIQIPTIEEVLTADSAQVTAYGFVSIEVLQFQQPLLIGLTNQQLMRGGVVMFPERSLTQDNFVILGHHLGRESLLFGLLKQAKVGMEVRVTYLEQTHTYTIDAIKEVAETDLEVIGNQQPHLTLITCPTPTRTDQRLVITAKPISMAVKEDAQTETTKKETQKIRHQQKQLWQQQARDSWGILLLLFLMMWGCLWGTHRLMTRKTSD